MLGMPCAPPPPAFMMVPTKAEHGAAADAACTAFMTRLTAGLSR